MPVSDSVSMPVTAQTSLQFSAVIVEAPGSGNATVIDAVLIGPDHGNSSPASRFEVRLMSKDGSTYTDETGWMRVNALSVGTACFALGAGVQIATNKPLYAQFQASSSGKYRIGVLHHAVSV